ncbi:MAG TPA: hypothetical protein VLO00_03130 [Cryobacterium sp.]|nr:hypothetical protein [Cryobacterium sp.]
MSTLLDDRALGALLRQLGGDAGAQCRFAQDFVDLWQPRADRLVEALGHSLGEPVGDSAGRTDAEQAHVVLLSIRSSSVMVGAVVLEATAGLIHSALARGDFDGCRQHLPRLLEVGARTCRELAELFPR